MSATEFLVDAETGQVIEDCENCRALERDLRVKRRRITILEAELAEKHAADKNADRVRDVLEYWRDRLMPRAKVPIDGVRADRVRAALKTYTIAELKQAIDGAAVMQWVDPKTHQRRDSPPVPSHPRDGRFVDLELILRNEKKIDDFKAFAEDASVGLLATTDPYDPSPHLPPPVLPADGVITGLENTLRESPHIMRRVEGLLGWSPGVLAVYRIGWDGSWLRIPVVSAAGEMVNVLRYRPTEDGGPFGMRGLPRDPFPAPDSLLDPLWVVSGEPTALTLLSHDLNAVGLPNGVWLPEWAPRFRGRDVTVALECDPVGRKTAYQVARDLELVAEVVRVVDVDSDRADSFGPAQVALMDGTGQRLRRLREQAVPFGSSGPVQLGMGA